MIVLKWAIKLGGLKGFENHMVYKKTLDFQSLSRQLDSIKQN